MRAKTVVLGVFLAALLVLPCHLWTSAASGPLGLDLTNGALLAIGN